ncbi:hypothetical protein PsorP6_017220 [Peronosclerospora sorghi]|uniref:Uncharacterized protein n=1 Tax=Peronosclerospora sorghi TaxID=230839 RepID=A0ACC0WGQ3_9STRA|nr:hypothetical protein PsorP6_017220 [Peronosclerospora sorghi]
MLLIPDVVVASGVVSIYNINDPMYGTCRLKGVEASSDNFKFYASVSSKDFKLNDACARCIIIKRDDNVDKTTTAYVLDVCDGCASGTLKLSADAMAALEIDTTDSATKVSYAFDTCPASLMTGDIKACLMEGASGTYVPLQFYNSQRVITSATIDGVKASSTPSSFLYSANIGSSSSNWYQSVDFSVTSEDGETLNSTLEFSSTSGCATSTVQFNSASTGEGSIRSLASTSSGAIIGAICGGIAVLLIIIGSVIFVRRRRLASNDVDELENDPENQYLSPKAKPNTLPAATDINHSDHDDPQPPASPTVDYAESFSPAASLKAPGSKLSGMSSPISLITPNRFAAASNSSPLSDNSSVPSAPSSHYSSVERYPSPETISAAPTFAFSNGMATPTVRTVPVSSPAVPRQSSYSGFPDDDAGEERSSFDIDDMRESETRAMSMDNSLRKGSQAAFVPYSAADPYANTMTSPQSNIRATSLRRPSTNRNSSRKSGRELGQYSNYSDPDSYASTAPRQTNGSIISNGPNLQSSRSNPSPARPGGLVDAETVTNMPTRDSYASFGAQHDIDLYASQRNMGLMRESGGYSRESLNLLGYPYAKKSGRHLNTTVETLAFVVIGASLQKVAHNASEKYKEGKFILELAKTDEPPYAERAYDKMDERS